MSILRLELFACQISEFSYFCVNSIKIIFKKKKCVAFDQEEKWRCFYLRQK